jgi:hypothetical protein
MNHIEAVKVCHKALELIAELYENARNSMEASQLMYDARCIARGAIAATENIEQDEPVGEIVKTGLGMLGTSVNGKLILSLPHGTKLYATPQPAPQQAKADAIASDWMPIETAPKNEEQILTFSANLSGSTFGEKYSDWYQTSFWSDTHKIYIGWPFGMKPTHWMPLPAAPSTDKPL